MRKLLFFVTVMMMAVCVSAQKQYKLIRFSDDNGLELTNYCYNSEYRLVAIHTVDDGSDPYEVYDSLIYNVQGNMVKLSGWQKFGEGFRNVYYIDYTYDTLGRVSSRSNYNFQQGEWQLGGVYEYTYDQNGYPLLTTLTMGGSVFQKIEYTNDANGIVEELWSMTDFDGGFEPTEKLTYVREGGLLKEVYDSTYNEGSWAMDAFHRYTYDENGNCTKHSAYDAAGDESERQIYTIDTKRVDECLIPWTPEMSDEARLKHLNVGENVNVYTVEEYWTRDANFVLQHMCDYEYEYIGINESGIGDVVAPKVVRGVRKVMINGVLYIECGDRMYDIAGRRVR